GHDGEVVFLGFAGNGKYLASSDYYSRAKIWDFSSGKEVAQLIATGDDDWLVTTPDGLFDGTPNAWKQLMWRFGGNTFDHAPVEAFFKEFYRPGLLKDIMDGKIPEPPKKDLSQIDTRQPDVNIVAIDGHSTTDTNSTDKRVVKVRVEVIDNQTQIRKGV